MSEFEEGMEYEKEHCVDCERLRKSESGQTCKPHRQGKNTARSFADLHWVYNKITMENRARKRLAGEEIVEDTTVRGGKHV